MKIRYVQHQKKYAEQRCPRGYFWYLVVGLYSGKAEPGSYNVQYQDITLVSVAMVFCPRIGNAKADRTRESPCAEIWIVWHDEGLVWPT